MVCNMDTGVQTTAVGGGNGGGGGGGGVGGVGGGGVGVVVVGGGGGGGGCGGGNVDDGRSSSSGGVGVDITLNNATGSSTVNNSLPVMLTNSVNLNNSRQSPKVCVNAPASATAAASSASSASSALLLQQQNTLSSSIPRKIMSKNTNNTVFPTSYPSNLAELQLYRVMQNASLLLYYDTLLEMGGDDVQQICDAGEEEFLEIMSLVGMASKPLHVRRFQKSLQEWVTNPTKFKMPLVPGEDFEIELSSPRVTSNHVFYNTVDGGDNSNRIMYSPSPGDICALPPPVSSPGLTNLTKRPYSPLDPSCPTSSNSSPGSNMSSQLTPTLMENQIIKLAAAAERLSKQLPQYEPKPHNTKKKVCKELELVMSMPENDPRRMDEIRRYAAIYGRFDCKRKPEKPLTLHEVSVNEAAAQICRFIPALLTRRDELFPLARQVVKDSGCYYAKTQITSIYTKNTISDSLDSTRNSSRIMSDSNDGHQIMKKPKLEITSTEGMDDQRQDTCFDDTIMRTSLHSLFRQHSKNHHITSREPTRRSSIGVELDDSDSHFPFSNSNSPQFSVQEQDSYTTFNSIHKKMDDSLDNEDDDGSKFSPKVIAASGDNIIAVANPALAMSPAIIVPLRTDKD